MVKVPILELPILDTPVTPEEPPEPISLIVIAALPEELLISRVVNA